jgi:hypothetical protein
MITLRELPRDGLRRVRPQLVWMLLGAALALAGCSSGGGSDDTAAPPAPPPPPPPAAIPPVSSTVIDIEDGHRVGTEHWAPGNSSTGGQGQPIGTMQCLNSQPVTFHVHAHLAIFLNGEQLAIPTRLGFVTGTSNDCHYPLHTHDWSGRIHVHAPAPTTFTLGQLFQTWGQSLTSADLAGLTGMPVRVFVNEDGDAVATEVTGEANWANIQLTSLRHITIQVGTDITEIPQYTWIGP